MAYVLDASLGRQIVVPRVTIHTVDPAVGDDAIHGYTPGDVWVNTDNSTVWVQLSGATGAASWTGYPSNAITSGTITGVTVDDSVIGGVTPAAGTFTTATAAQVVSTGFIDDSIAIGLTAVGTNRGNSLALTKAINVVATAASSAVGVTLPDAATVGVGGRVRVINDGPSNSFHVYAAGTDTIDGTAGSTGVALTNAFMCDYVVTAAGAYVSYRSAVTRSA